MLDVLSPHLKEALGPLHTDWFELLTAKVSAGPSAEDHGSTSPSYVQEHCFKTPVGEVSMESEIFSTPKIFRERGTESPIPITQDEELHHSDRGTGAPKILDHADSPFSFGSAKHSHAVRSSGRNQLSGNCFGFLDTPRSSVSQSVKRISESLGAQIDPDESWTSSLNTPPVLSPTVILTKTSDSSCLVSCSGDKQAIFVRKLFPSLSEASGINKLPSNKDKAVLHFEPLRQFEKAEFASTATPDVTPSVWKQKMPEAIRDREVRSTVAYVLGGAEDVLSVIFSNGNNNSLVQKTKASERCRRNQPRSTCKDALNNPTEDTVASVTSTIVELCKDPVTIVADEVQLIGDCSDTSHFAESSLTAASCEITQWTPLTLPDSEIIHTEKAHSLPSSEGNTAAPSNASVGKQLFANPPESFTLYAKNEAMDRVVPTHRGHNSDMQDKNKSQYPDSYSTGGEEPKSGQLKSSPTDNLLLNVQAPELNHSCQPDGDTSPGKLSQCSSKIQKENRVFQSGGSELLQVSQEGFVAMSSIRKPPRKFFYTCQNPGMSGQTSNSTTANNHSFSAPAATPFSGDSPRDMQSGRAVFFSEGKHKNITMDLLDCQNMCEQYSGKVAENSNPMVSEKENGLCDTYAENPMEDKNSGRECSLKTNTFHNLQNGCTGTLTSAMLQGMTFLAEASLNKVISNTEHEMTTYEQSALMKENSVVSMESTHPVNVSESNDCLSDGVKMTSGNQKSESGYYTSWSNVIQFPGSSDGISRPRKGIQLECCFKTASEKIISLPWEAIQRAKALLNETVEDNTRVGQSRNLIENSNNVTQSKDLGMEANVGIFQVVSKYDDNVSEGNGHPCKSAMGNNSQSAPNSLSHFTGQSPSHSLIGCKAASNTVLQVYSKKLARARQLFEVDEKQLKKNPDINVVTGSGKVEKEAHLHGTSEAAPVFHVSSSHHGHLDDYCSLTASQRADVAELCSILEEAYTQFEFTQFQQEKKASNRRDELCLQHPCDTEIDPDLLKGIDFDDSLCEKQVDRQESEEIEASEELLPNIKQSMHDSSFKTETVTISSCDLADKPMEKSLCASQKDGNNFLVHNNTSNLETFYSARSVKMTVPEDYVKKASGVGLDLCCVLSSVSENSHSVKDKCDELQHDILKFQRQDLSKVTTCYSTEQGNLNTKEFSAKELHITSVFDKGKQSLENVKWKNFKSHKSGSSNLAHCVDFKTPTGSAVSISERSLSRVTAMFADLEEDYRSGNEQRNNSHMNLKRHNAEMKNEYSQAKYDHSKAEDTLNCNSAIEYSNNLIRESLSKRLCFEVNSTAKEFDTSALQTKEMSKRDFVKNACNLPSGSGYLSVEDKESEENLQQIKSQLKKPVENSSECEHSIGDKFHLSLRLQCEKDAGFKTASGKCVFISEKALEQAKTIFRDCDETASCEITRVENTSGNEITPASSSAFTFASGKGVSISAQALQQAKAVFRNRDKTTIYEMTACVDRKTTDGKNSGEGVSISVEEIDKTNCFLKDCDNILTSGTEMKKPVGKDDSGTSGSSHFGFSNTCEEEMCVSEMLPLKPKAPVIEYDKPTDHTVFGLTHEISSGFSTASGKGVSISTKAMQKAKALFAAMEDTSFCDSGTQDMNRDGRSNFTDSLCAETRNWGFSTAGGKKVTVSEMALRKARGLLDQSDNIEKAKPEKYFGTLKCTKDNARPLECQNSKDSNKGLSTSLKEAGEAQLKFYDCLESEMHGKFENHVKMECGSGLCDSKTVSCSFRTAGGKGVVITGKALKEAKALFEDCDNLENVTCPKINRPARKSRSFYSAHQNSGDGPFSDRETEIISENSCQKEALLSCDRNEQANGLQKVSNTKLIAEQAGAQKKLVESLPSLEVPQQNSSLLNLGFSGCTMTQQKYLEQEAMACTKALLEDEEFTRKISQQHLEDSPCEPHTASQHLDQSNSTEQRIKSLKRFRPVDFHWKDQPPLKRQLLTEFERTSNGGKHSYLTPLKSSPNGTLNDRRTFKYSMPLQPVVTRPSFNKSSEELKLQKKSEMPHKNSKHMKPTCNAFLPPFQKQLGAKIVCDTGSQRPSRPTGTFVPPFRSIHFKMNSDLKDNPAEVPKGKQSTCKSQASAAPNVFVPPTKKKPASVSELGATCDAGEKGLNCGAPNPAPALPTEEKANCSETQLMPLENLQNARDLQEMRIMKKKRQTIRPQPGSLLLAKTSGGPRVSLKNAFGGRTPTRYTEEELYIHGVHRFVSQINSSNAESLHFHCSDFFRQEVLTEGCGVQLGDGGWLIPTNDGTVGKEEFYRTLCDTPGVDPKLISESWVYNHYRWVVWKQASMEKSFPEQLGSRCLTPEQVLLQLKYRYDVEVDQSRRSALRKIMERDDTPAKTLVLCVCGIASNDSTLNLPAQSENKTIKDVDTKNYLPTGVIWVTDGWYAIRALLDAPLTTMVRKGRLAAGVKIVTHGAELVGSQDACTPLEAPSTLMLKVMANSTRPARWDAKLGFHCDPRPFRLPLSSLYSNGGLVGCVDIVVLRSYPVQWMEKLPNGAFVFRNGRAEDREARRHSDTKQKHMEALFNKVQAQFEKDQEVKSKPRGRRQIFTRQEIEALQEGVELHEAVDSDPTCLEVLLSEKQLETLRNYRRSLEEEKQARLQEQFRQALEEAQKAKVSCSDREVTPVWKLCISDCQEQADGRGYFLNIWRPSADLQTLLKEGSCYRVYNLATSEAKKRTSNVSIQLSATKKTQFRHIQTSSEALSELFQPRVCVSFPTLLNPGFHPLCKEVDVVGFVISITDKQCSFPVVYLANECLDLVAVRCSCSLAQLAVEEVVRPQALLAFSNLQLCCDTSAPMPVLYASDLALFSANPQEPHLQEACLRMKKAVQGHEHFFGTAEEKLFNIILSDRCSLPSPKVEAFTPKTPCWSTRQPDKNIDTTPTPPKPVGCTTLVNQKPPTLTSNSEEQDPKRLKRKRGLDYLSRIPSPPPLQPLGTTASLPVSRNFLPPRQSETPGSVDKQQRPVSRCPPTVEDDWVNDEELAMINTQGLMD
ncbi:breast cancer type 2 susceptibility protein isoform X1 [Scleropages formosus]|uniref:breast cancer type 2 susceptibility protein isoform X1 n=1 Tax=Scleropages formosus TaxID=113540 RepID=UPI0010FA7AD4|nr:breast cancer type 2 susceptibility protein isoform X1 [Scleropages formosus]